MSCYKLSTESAVKSMGPGQCCLLDRVQKWAWIKCSFIRLLKLLTLLSVKLSFVSAVEHTSRAWSHILPFGFFGFPQPCLCPAQASLPDCWGKAPRHLWGSALAPPVFLWWGSNRINTNKKYDWPINHERNFFLLFGWGVLHFHFVLGSAYYNQPWSPPVSTSCKIRIIVFI